MADKYNLFIGRFQPFHKGHEELINTVLQKGKKVLIGLRETGIDENNPYTYEERAEMIRDVYPDKDNVKIIKIPDIEAVCYGRKVGYDIMRIRLEDQLEKISATKIRNSSKKIIWLTGNVKSGKTSIAYLLKEKLNAVVLDGDEMRKSISLGAGFSKEDREEHNLRVGRLANVLHKQGHNVIVSVIAPFRSTRKKLTELCDPIWIYVKGGIIGKETPYEAPVNPALVVDTKNEKLIESVDKIMRVLR